MTIYQYLFLAFLASLPLIVLGVIGRHMLSMYRSVRSRKLIYSIYSLLAISAMTLIFAGVGFAWFGYAVGHGKKEIKDDLLLVAISIITIYGGGYSFGISLVISKRK